MTRPPVIVALDLPSRAELLATAKLVQPYVAMAKIGLEAFCAHGAGIVEDVRGLGLEVFLDLKLHDIPNTVGRAAEQLSALDVRLLTVHAQGGPDMVRAARDALPASTQVIAVTVLTSLDQSVLSELGVERPLASYAVQLGRKALAAGADGLVCSPHELHALQALGGIRVVPGVRPAAEAGGDDQRRVATPEQARAQGATWLVVGRPITQAPDPAVAARRIASSLEGGS